MMTLDIHHTTTYRYANPVTFGDHRLMFRPRDSHDLRLIETGLVISPPPASVRWLHDVFGNSIAVARFDQPATELRFESHIRVDHYPMGELEFPIEDYARSYPFSYSAEEVPDLALTTQRHYPDPDHLVDEWARQFVTLGEGGPPDTQDMLVSMTRAIKDTFTYQARDLEGTQSPVDTLTWKSGSCRDFALLMMEAVRSLGFAARFVSGYLYDPARDGQEGAMTGGGATHAWVEIYLPGCGWVEFDPTNGIIGGKNLIRVAVARDPSQAVPLGGSWTGAPADFLGMTVDVQVTANGGAGAGGAPQNPAPAADAA
ncbi:transglutaminase family protein [Azospirillum formosense]|uniref:Transglutaminase family protein n=1 Tax=Azospirillum formosense TaxID=861533 RepID=A0ABX2L0R1_9PROT|nr:transglutaminase family protein [Azospirillum formosense]MBY3754170.1 transglutaminase family protein [Azospirillum formosense]NUB20090.1 transglutaminase family protein [Azospirillum formosense]